MQTLYHSGHAPSPFCFIFQIKSRFYALASLDHDPIYASCVPATSPSLLVEMGSHYPPKAGLETRSSRSLLDYSWPSHCILKVVCKEVNVSAN